MKLKDKTTLIIGTLAGLVSGYQKEKLEQEYLKKQLKKTLRKYWQFANNVEIVYSVMDHISWKLLASALDTVEDYELMLSLYKEDELTDDQKKQRADLVEKAQGLLEEALNNGVYANKVEKHRQYILKLNVLGVDTKLTTQILVERIAMVQAFIDLLQEIIDSFAGGKDNAIVGKFNARLKKFTKRLLKIVEYINDNYPEEEFDLNGTDDRNSFTNPIFNEDIITSDEGDTTKRFYADLANAEGEPYPDGVVDKNDVLFLKKIIKYFHNLSKEDQLALIKSIDVNGDGFLNSDDTEWLESYTQDQEEIESLHEQGEYLPYYDSKTRLTDHAKEIIEQIGLGTYHTDEPAGVDEPNAVHTPSSSGYLFNSVESNDNTTSEESSEKNEDVNEQNTVEVTHIPDASGNVQIINVEE